MKNFKFFEQRFSIAIKGGRSRVCLLLAPLPRRLLLLPLPMAPPLLLLMQPV